MNNTDRNNNLCEKHWKLVNFCEFDPYAVKSYCVIHNVDDSLNLGDITKIDETKLDDFDFMTWGFPCTDISVAGKQKGFIDEKGEKTRSGMYYEGIRILRYKKPKFSLIENVKNLTGKKFKKEFETVLSDLEDAGYNSYYRVLNAKDFGVPQNRERVFILSIRKDVDNGQFKFPEPFDNGIRLKDILENEVNEKFYISNEKTKKFIENLNHDMKDNGKNIPDFIGNIHRPDFGTGYAGGVWNTNNISPTLTTMQGGGRQPHIITGLVSNKGEKFERETEYANTLPARDYKGFGNQAMNAVIDINNIRIRKLTPKECYRLMSFTDEDFCRAEKVVSNSQLYKQAGNSIVADVLYYILVELYKAMPYLFDDLRLSSYFSGIGAFEIALNKLYEGINSGNFTQPQED